MYTIKTQVWSGWRSGLGVLLGAWALGISGCDLGAENLNKKPIALPGGYAEKIFTNADLSNSPTPTLKLNLAGRGHDYDGQIVAYQWQLLSATSLDKTSPSNSRDVLNSATLHRPSSAQMKVSLLMVEADYQLQLTVTDNGGATASANTNIRVRKSGTPQKSEADRNDENLVSVSAGPDLWVISGDPVQLVATPYKLSGPISYVWRQIQGPALGSSLGNPTSRSSGFTAPRVETETTYIFEVEASAGTQSTTDTVSVTVAARENTPPSISPIANQTTTAGVNVSISANATDADGSISSYTWTQLSGNRVTLQNRETASVSFIAPAVNQVSTIQLQLQVTDKAGDSAEASTQVTINPAVGNNLPPTANAGLDRTVNSGAPVTLTGVGSDSGGSIASYQWSRVSGPNVTLTASGSQVSFTAPNVTVPTAVGLRLTVTDNSGLTAFDEVLINVLPVNMPPSVNAGLDRSVIAGQLVSITASVSDSDGTIQSTSWRQISGPPVTLAFANSNQVVSFTAPSAGTINLELTATDNAGASVTDLLVITVSSVSNIAPAADAGLDQTVVVGNVVQLNGSGRDTDGSISSYQWVRLAGPNISLQNSTLANASFTAPSVTQATTVSLQLTVTDNTGASASDVVVITITPPNLPPQAFAGLDLTIGSGRAVTIAGSGTDSDGFISAYRWTQLTGSAITLEGATSANLSFAAPVVSAVTTFSFQLQVTDNNNATATDVVVVSVTPSNVPPVAVATAAPAVSSGDPATLIGSQSRDSDSTVLTYQWSQLSGPAVVLTAANTAVAQFTAPIVSVNTALGFRLTVTDNLNASHAADVSIQVIPLRTLSGQITVASGNMVDSDINQVEASTVIVTTPNNSVSTPQHISNPVLLGGYVNQPGRGVAGRSFTSGDIDDYFHIDLTAGQVISLAVSNAQTGVNEMGLYLLADLPPNNVVAVSNGGGNLESVTVTASGPYYLRVRAELGASSYVLSTGGGTILNRTEIRSNGWTLADDFVPGDIIANYLETTALETTAQETTASPFSLTLQAVAADLPVKAGAPGRNRLLGLPGKNGTTLALAAATTLSDPTDPVNLKTADPALQEKYDTLIAAVALRRQGNVESVGLNYRLYPTAVPNDQYYNRQWHYPLINLPQAWDTTTGSNSVIVAVVDTGILLNHPDLTGGKLTGGYDFIRDNTNSGDLEPGIDTNPNDTGDGGGTSTSSFHGTHVAGTIAANSNNSIGVAGVAWNVRVMPLRVIGINGATTYDVEQGIRFAAGLSNDSGQVPPQRADIINLSLGGPTTSTNAPAVYQQARAAGVIIIAAAGNDGNSQLSAPAAYNGVVSVSAVTINRQLASYSNFGSTIDVAAPGGFSGDLNSDGFTDAIFSSSGDDSVNPTRFVYNFKIGTSMAAPHVAGVAALMKSVLPGLTPAQFDTLLANGELTQDLGSAGRDNSFGNGLIDAAKAVQAALNAGGIVPTPVNPPVLSVSPSTLNFGIGLTQNILSLGNSGGGTLSVGSVSASSSGWLSVSPRTVNSAGVGDYSVSVNRSGLADNIYTGSLSIQSNGGNQTVPVSMQVLTLLTEPDAGPQIIELLDATTGRLVDKLVENAVNGIYQYSFPSVHVGQYTIRSSSNLDNDLVVICELGESCGAYPLLGSTLSNIVRVDGSTTTNLINLDFQTGFNTSLPAP